MSPDDLPDDGVGDSAGEQAGNRAGEHRTRLTDGREVSTQQLFELLYDDLRRLADSYFRRERQLTIQPTVLVHEVWIKLAAQDKQDWESRGHFMAVAATAMRRLLTNAARDRRTRKRGGDWQQVTLDESARTGDQNIVDLLDLEDALVELAEVNERYVRILELRSFAGLSLDEVAEVIGVGRTLVVREWGKAKAWLAAKLEERAEG